MCTYNCNSMSNLMVSLFSYEKKKYEYILVYNVVPYFTKFGRCGTIRFSVCKTVLEARIKTGTWISLATYKIKTSVST